ncbi:hypothetical protein E3T61_08790 [Cryobacterium lactosi]|uniref:Uncharacterized protein n=1 Tax=Cryobacterium lactosi TaxID=1259202 RepID=A0A4R9BW04_9MICO|nr:hypothetical protein [Cryobacterium lactosi]TFD91551.1 hypothetical protein E3T61_08790 [Cryobacterium lactosi]
MLRSAPHRTEPNLQFLGLLLGAHLGVPGQLLTEPGETLGHLRGNGQSNTHLPVELVADAV